MQTTESPIDLAAARRARTPARPATTGDRWADLHGMARRAVPTPPTTGTVLPFRPSR